MQNYKSVAIAYTGTLCRLAGLRDSEHAAAGPLAGGILETAVLIEIVKTFLNRGDDAQVYFWRTSAGVEVDFVVETEGKLIPIEVKSTATPHPAMAHSITTFQKDMKENAAPGYVVHTGSLRLPLAPRVTTLPLGEL